MTNKISEKEFIIKYIRDLIQIFEESNYNNIELNIKEDDIERFKQCLKILDE